MMTGHDLTVGSTRKHLIRLGLPMLIGMLVNNLYGIFDLYWVSRLGDAPVASISVAYNLMVLVMAIGQILSVGIVALVAQAAGRKDAATVHHLFHQAAVLSLVVGLCFVVPLMLARGWLAEVMTTEAETELLTEQVLTWFIPALGLLIPMLTVAAALRGLGNVRAPVRVQLGSIVLNMALSPLLIFGWVFGIKLDTQGAPVATLIALSVSNLWLLIYSLRHDHLQLGSASWRPDWQIWRKVIRIGFPAGSEFGLMAVFFGFALWVLSRYGAEAQAAFGIGMRWLQIGMTPAFALGFAVAAVAGQNYGAGLLDRVQQSTRGALMMGLISTTITAIIGLLMPATLMSMFTDDPKVMEVGVELIRVLAWNLIASSVVITLSGVFSGLGKTLPPLLGQLVRYSLAIGACSILLAVNRFEIIYMWQIQVATTALQAVMTAWMLRALMRRERNTPAVGAMGLSGEVR